MQFTTKKLIAALAGCLLLQGGAAFADYRYRVPLEGSARVTIPEVMLVSEVTSDVQAIPANGTSVARLRAVVRDSDGKAVPSGVTVHWATTGGTLSAATSRTNGAGVATIQLTSSTLMSTAVVTAALAADGVAGQAKSVAFDADSSTARVVDLTPREVSIIGNNTASAAITALVQDANGNPLGGGIAVNWATDFGALSSSASTTDANGRATVTLRSGTAPVGAMASVTARTASASFEYGANVTFISDARWQFSASTVSYPATPEGGAAPATVTLTNVGTTPEKPTLEPSEHYEVTTGCDVIQPGGNCVVTVSFKPTTRGNPLSGTLTARGPAGTATTNLTGEALPTAWEGFYNTGILSSANGYYQLRMEPNCNLVVYAGGNGGTQAVWSTGTAGTGTGCSLYLQRDGNIVIYKADGASYVWASGSLVGWNENRWLEMGNDGKLYYWGAVKGSRTNLIWKN